MWISIDFFFLLFFTGDRLTLYCEALNLFSYYLEGSESTKKK